MHNSGRGNREQECISCKVHTKAWLQALLHQLLLRLRQHHREPQGETCGKVQQAAVLLPQPLRLLALSQPLMMCYADGRCPPPSLPSRQPQQPLHGSL